MYSLFNLFKSKSIEEEIKEEIEFSFKMMLEYEKQLSSSKLHVDFYKDRIDSLNEHLNKITYKNR
jgi:hypothetical protein